MNVVNYLAVGKLPKHLTPKEIKLVENAALGSPGSEDTSFTQEQICISVGVPGKTKSMTS